jgi:hypothetical protein
MFLPMQFSGPFLLKHALCLTVTLQPAKKNAYAQSGDNVFTPVERELIFDIVSHLHCWRLWIITA